MTTATTSPQPEQGQMVSVRSRNWMITDVSASTLPPERLQTGVEAPQHLLTLSSVEDDGLGEELNVIWELEPGARVVEKVALPEPTGFDAPAQLDAFLDAVRWGASSSADVRNIQAPFRFGIEDSNLMKELRRKRGIHVNPWNHFPRLITSIDFLKRERPLRLFREVLPGPDEPAYPRKFDMLIVDEAHNCAPAGRGRYATDSMRTQALRLLVPHFEHKLFLTATPHNGYPESFSALLEL